MIWNSRSYVTAHVYDEYGGVTRSVELTNQSCCCAQGFFVYDNCLLTIYAPERSLLTVTFQ